MPRKAQQYNFITNPLATTEEIERLLAEGVAKTVICRRFNITARQLQLVKDKVIPGYTQALAEEQQRRDAATAIRKANSARLQSQRVAPTQA